MAVGCVMTLYSLIYFCRTLSTIDANEFRGLTENFIRTKNLNPSQGIRGYYEWPSFFILANIATLVSGLELTTYEFLLFAIIGFLLATALYVYASKAYAHGGFLAVLAFFIVMFYFMNYQAVPFSLALGLLFLLFMLETQKKSSGAIVTILVLYVSISITHAFVPLFFVIYLLVRGIVSKSKQYLNLFMLTSLLYFLVQFTLAQFSFPSIISSIITLPKEYSGLVSSALAPASVMTDVVAQAFSRMVTIGFGIICFAGFIMLIIKRKMREIDKAIFLTGLGYSGLGVVLYTLGSRALPLVFIPISIGVLYMYQSKLRPYLKCSILIMLVLVVSIPIHNSFGNPLAAFQVTLQTKEAQTTANFMIEKYNWNLVTKIVADLGQIAYLDPQVAGQAVLENVFSPSFKSQGVKTYDCVIYNVGFERELQSSGISAEEMSQEIQSEFDVIYNSGSSYSAVRP